MVRRDSTTGRHPHRWAALGAISTATLMVVLDTSIVNVALPQAQVELGIGQAERHWMVTAYAVPFGSLLLLGGAVADRLGHARALRGALLGFALASAFGGLAGTGATLFAARALQGAFAAVLAPTALALVSTLFMDEAERLRAFSVYGAVQGAGGAVGLVLGGALTQWAGWRWCMFVNLPIAAAALSAMALTVPLGPGSRARSYDLVGAASATLGVALLVLGLTFAAEPARGWLAPSSVACLAAAPLLLTCFAWHQARTARPMLPLRILRSRSRSGCYVASLLLGGGMFGTLLLLTFFLQGSLGFSPLVTGLAFLPFSLGIVASAGASPRLVRSLGATRTMAGGLLAAAAGEGWLVGLQAGSTFAASVLPAELVMALGVGLVFAPMNDIALDRVPPGDAGAAGAVLTMAQQLGGGLGVALLNAVFATAAAGQPPGVLSLFAGYRAGFGAAALAFGLAAIAVLLLVRTADLRRDKRMDTWLVTGASSGLGAALARRVLEHGHRVIGTSRDVDRLADLSRDFSGFFTAMALDLADPGAARRMVVEVERRVGPLDVLVNNAGQAYFGAVEEGEDAAVRQMFEANYFGPFNLVRAVLPGMRERRRGAIVNVSSLSGLVAFPGLGHYSASKFALEGLTEALWQEVEPLGIRVMLVEPGTFRTGINGRTPRAPSITGCSPVADQMLDFIARSGEAIELGDPALAADNIVAAVEAENPPKRLVLGSDAYAAATGKLRALLAELESRKNLSGSTDMSR